MLRLLASGLLTRSASRRIARVIPNPLVRTLAVAATGYAVSRALAPRACGPPQATFVERR